MKYDAAIIGGGFYGCNVAIELSLLGKKVILLEKEDDIMQRASYANQARIHQGYHYPRSVLTALRSRVNFNRFVQEYDKCVYSKFDMYYAIGKISSKINADQFRTFCERIGAPTEKATKEIHALFNPTMIDDVFKVTEYAFDTNILKEIMLKRLKQAGVEMLLNCHVDKIQESKNILSVEYKFESKDNRLKTDYLFNCTYSSINQIMASSALPLIPLKHEMAEMALIKVPEVLKNIGVTLMDGPFFSIMPYPARDLHTLSHVRYTPHHYWQDSNDSAYLNAHDYFNNSNPVSSHLHMIKDAQRYMPVLENCHYVDSLWEIKTVLPQSEVDDSRPILFRRTNELYNAYSIMGGKIDNIFDIREKLHKLYVDKQERT